MKKLCKVDVLIPVLLYSLVLFWTTLHLSYTLVSDRYNEFQVFSRFLDTGVFSVGNDTLLASSVLTTFVPACIVRWTHIDSTWLFLVWPQLFLALVPVFVYLMSRVYLNRRYSLVAVAFVLTNFYFLYYNEMGRVNAGFALFSGVVYALVAGKRKTGIVCAVLLPFAHYGSYFILTGVLVGVLLLALVLRGCYSREAVVRVAMVLSVLLVVGLTWHIGIVRSSFQVSKGAVERSLSNVSLSAPVEQTVPPSAGETVVAGLVPFRTSPAPVLTPVSVPAGSKGNYLFDLSNREAVIQVAFGSTFSVMTLPQRLEFVVSWLSVLFLAASVLYALFSRSLSLLHVLLSVGVVVVFLAGLIFPFASLQYGIARFYMTACLVLAPCVPLLIRRIGRWGTVALPVIAVHALLLSGVLYSWLGFVK